ncbi:MAG: DDE-type integrase/transposase/recombinase [Gammaproteobacteria bacterium]|nr:DDE-type integrase/transposase/recombinase [Gammaproteobacteria bacterium]
MNQSNSLYHGYRFPAEIICHLLERSKSDEANLVTYDIWMKSTLCRYDVNDDISGAVDHNGNVLDNLVQKRKDKHAAAHFFKKLKKDQGRSAKEIVTDKLTPYGAMRKVVMPTSMHCDALLCEYSCRNLT